jgi:2-polyprenyl-3-methyl-5-hydroxy-6-metoxy-1,4-benzoquinol methylase
LQNSHRTAITRKLPSVPARWLHKEGLLIGDCLDYGCGKGFDADYFRLDSYDPYYRNIRPSKTYDTIICIYVLNVVEEQEREEILRDIYSLLKPSGKAYIVVRRDIKKTGITSRGTHQYDVRLNFPVIRDVSNYTIYSIAVE